MLRLIQGLILLFFIVPSVVLGAQIQKLNNKDVSALGSIIQKQKNSVKNKNFNNISE